MDFQQHCADGQDIYKCFVLFAFRSLLSESVHYFVLRSISMHYQMDSVDCRSAEVFRISVEEHSIAQRTGFVYYCSLCKCIQKAVTLFFAFWATSDHGGAVCDIVDACTHHFYN